MAETSLMANTIIGSVYPRFKKEVFDSISDNQVVMREIKAAGGLKFVPGGQNLQCNVYFTEIGNFGSYSQLDVFPLISGDPVRQALYEMKQFRSTIILSGFDEWRNSSSAEQIFPLVREYVGIVKKSMKLGFSQQILQSDGTGNGGKDLGGLPLLVTSSTSATVGNISKTTFTRWRNQFVSSVGSAAANLRPKMSTLYNAVMKNGEKVQLWLSTSAIDEALENTVTTNERYILERKKDAYVNLGIPHKFFKDAPFVWDTDTNSGLVYALNFSYLYLWIGSGHDFDMTDFIRPSDQDGRSAAILLYAQMGTSGGQYQGLLEGVTTP